MNTSTSKQTAQQGFNVPNSAQSAGKAQRASGTQGAKSTQRSKSTQKAVRKQANPFKLLASVDSLNFWLTNRIPRVLLTKAVGRFSRIKSRPLAHSSIAVWRLFSDLDTESTVDGPWDSLQSFFTRPLKPDARPICNLQSGWASPSDAIVGASGQIKDGKAVQIKGMPYSVAELLGLDGAVNNKQASVLEVKPVIEGEPDYEIPHFFHDWNYLTLRLTSGMYHRFHAPCKMRIKHVRYISGDVFNVNPPALARVPALFCRNERAVLFCENLEKSGAPADAPEATSKNPSSRHAKTDNGPIDEAKELNAKPDNGPIDEARELIAETDRNPTDDPSELTASVHSNPPGEPREFIIVAVAAVLVASIRLHALGKLLTLNHGGPTDFALDHLAERGEELGWFEQGSTLMMFTPADLKLLEGIDLGQKVKMGEALLQEAQ